MTYRQMVILMNAHFTEDQWESHVTIEDLNIDECYSADLRIATEKHQTLDVGHPIISGGIMAHALDLIEESTSLYPSE